MLVGRVQSECNRTPQWAKVLPIKGNMAMGAGPELWHDDHGHAI